MRDRLTEKIIVEQRMENFVSDEGFVETEWKEYYKCWSAYKDISGKEFIAAKAINNENIVTFTVRYCNKIKQILFDVEPTKNYHIKFYNKIYNIIFISDRKNEHNFVDIKCNIIQ